MGKMSVGSWVLWPWACWFGAVAAGMGCGPGAVEDAQLGAASGGVLAGDAGDVEPVGGSGGLPADGSGGLPADGSGGLPADGSGGQGSAASGGALAGSSGGLEADEERQNQVPEVTFPGTGAGFYKMEALDRGLVAVQTEQGVYLGWRTLGTEFEALAGEALRFVVYRDGLEIAQLNGSGNYLDAAGTAESSYQVALRQDTAEGLPVDAPLSEAVSPLQANYLRVPLEPPPGDYSANDASAADLDGDGAYELVLKWEPGNAKDNSQSGVTAPVFLDGLRLDGERLWRIELGPNIRAGAHYTQFVVMDLDGDGSAEVVVKTAPGTRDGRGEFLGLGPAMLDDDSAHYGNGSGYILSGPEYLTVFAGRTGAELATTEYVPGRGSVRSWGDSYGNRVDRFLATAAYLDDTGLPSVVMSRGYYTRSTLTAWNFRGGILQELWRFDSDETPVDSAGQPFAGQGCHSVSVANVDEDVGQELIYGAMTVDHDGTGMCSTGFGHGDALHVSDLVPDRPGVEVYMPHEERAQPAWSLRDGATCEVLQAGPVTDADVGRGVAADVDLASPGAELWASGGVPLTSAATGLEVGPRPPSINFVIYWDADDARELLDGTRIQRPTGETLLSCDSCAANNSTKATPALVADLFGDYREELVLREQDSSALRVYTTTELSQRLLYTLMHDPQYRVAVSFQNAGYNQPAHPSFSLAEGTVPVPDIQLGL